MKKGKCADVRIAIGGATATAVRARAAEELLTGQGPTPENIARAAATVSEALENPFGDSYASGEFRVHLGCRDDEAGFDGSGGEVVGRYFHSAQTGDQVVLR